MSKLIKLIVVALVFFFTLIMAVFCMLVMSLITFTLKWSKKGSLSRQEGSVIDGEYEIVYEK